MGQVVQMNEEQPAPYEPSFEDFWTMWPRERRVCKKDALLAWRRLPVEAQMECLLALMSWRQVWIARGEWQYVQHPHRWLQHERWTDELPPEFQRQKKTSADLGKARVESEKQTAERTPPPAEFYALLEKLKRHG